MSKTCVWNDENDVLTNWVYPDSSEILEIKTKDCGLAYCRYCGKRIVERMEGGD